MNSVNVIHQIDRYAGNIIQIFRMRGISSVTITAGSTDRLLLTLNFDLCLDYTVRQGRV